MAATGEKTLEHSNLKRSLIGAFHTWALTGLHLQNKDGGYWRVLKVWVLCGIPKVTWLCCVPGSSLLPPPYWKTRRLWGRGWHSPFNNCHSNVETKLQTSLRKSSFFETCSRDSKSVRFVADMSNKKLVIVRIHIFRVGILKVLKEYDVTQSKFCHNWGIPLALMIGRELCSITLQTMEMAWWWRNLFFSFSHTRFSEKLQRKWTLNLSMLKKQIDNNFLWSVLLSTKKWRQTCCAWFHLSFEHFC